MSSSDDRGYEVIDEDAAAEATSVDELAYAVLVGLSSRPKSLPSRYFYDDAGSVLFTKIMEAEEYYLTDCEDEILRSRATELASLFDRSFDLVDLGAGDGAKTMHILRATDEQKSPVTYMPVDISESAMEGLVERVRRETPGVNVHGLVGEYTKALKWIATHRLDRPKLVLFLGSNIGNMNGAQARGFLSRIWTHMNPEDRLLVGFDLKKSIELLLNAYNDHDGITAAFNLNLLTRLNRELGANFDISRFRHYGTYEVQDGAMHSYLVSRERQSVHIASLQRTFHFKAWEPIHVEYSYKYLLSDLDSLAEDSGYEIANRFTDHRKWFVDDLWRPRKTPKPV